VWLKRRKYKYELRVKLRFEVTYPKCKRIVFNKLLKIKKLSMTTTNQEL